MKTAIIYLVIVLAMVFVVMQAECDEGDAWSYKCNKKKGQTCKDCCKPRVRDDMMRPECFCRESFPVFPETEESCGECSVMNANERKNQNGKGKSFWGLFFGPRPHTEQPNE